ncbi:MAG TPA: selenocysteine-specific translation elongation factor [Longimicrobiaceae bacterium]|nr:selenocysteine-specific translation elongation factor [Longimicrobiaceae bacterium]
MRLIGTAGHIDHGKSTLVHALAGIHPSRLPEEHARGMTIDLGYAYLEHPAGYRLGIVDVPGHEKLVRNMVAGATGFELALWVVDARESVMPQSLEHLQILDLLGVRSLVPVLTKADLATDEQVEVARRDVEALLGRVGIPVQPAHVVDGVSGRGIAELKAAILASCGEEGESGGGEHPYLPVDRVFSLRGIGTVVTGTLVRGRLAEGDHVALSSLPGSWRARSLNNHHARVGEIGAGHRVGINLAGVEAGAVRRGDTLTAPGHPFAGRFLNVRLRWVEGAPREWKHGARLLFYAGCSETECRLWGVERDGEGGWGQVELPREACFFPGQHFILRGTTPLATVGGGTVLDLSPDRPRRVTPAERTAYELRERGEPWLGAYLAATGAPALDVSTLARRWMVPEGELRGQAESGPELRTAGSLVWRAEAGAELLERLRGFVARQPRGEQSVPFVRLGRELGARSPHLGPLLGSLLELDDPAAAFLRAHARLEKGGLVLHPGSVFFTPEEQRIADRLLERLRTEGLRPSRIRAYGELHPGRPEVVERVVSRLRQAGRVVPVSADLVLHPDAAEELREAPARHGLDGVRAAEFGRALGLSRKYGIPYLEYLNEVGILRREGDLHYRA